MSMRDEAARNGQLVYAPPYHSYCSQRETHLHNLPIRYDVEELISVRPSSEGSQNQYAKVHDAVCKSLHHRRRFLALAWTVLRWSFHCILGHVGKKR